MYVICMYVSHFDIFISVCDNIDVIDSVFDNEVSCLDLIMSVHIHMLLLMLNFCIRVKYFTC
jgi:hypothetical protein